MAVFTPTLYPYSTDIADHSPEGPIAAQGAEDTLAGYERNREKITLRTERTLNLRPDCAHISIYGLDEDDQDALLDEAIVEIGRAVDCIEQYILQENYLADEIIIEFHPSYWGK